MTGTCTIGEPDGDAVYNPGTGDTTQDWTVTYVGVCRIQAFTTRGNPAQTVQAGQRMSGSGYLVGLDDERPGADEVQPGMRVRVTSAPNDRQLVGEDLWVVDIILGTERFQRDLLCSTNQSDTPATP